MKNRILYFLLIITILVRISLYYELSIDSYKKQNISHGIVNSYNDDGEIKAVQVDRKVILTEVDALIYSLIIIFFITSSRNSKLEFKTLKIDKRKRIYWIIINKMQGSIYKSESLIL